MLVSPSIEPNSLDRFLVSPYIGLTRIRILYRRFGLLWTIACEVPLNLMQKACLAKAPITVDTKYRWRGARRDSIADFLDQHLSAEGIQQSRFIIMHDKTFLADVSHNVSSDVTRAYSHMEDFITLQKRLSLELELQSRCTTPDSAT